MRKVVFTIITLFALTFILKPTMAQEAVKDTSYWKKKSQFGLNLNQGSFSNFVAGGVNSIAVGAILNSKGEYNRDIHSWTNDFQFQYGTLWTNVQKDWRKSADRLFFDSKYARKIAPKWNLYANFNLLSQIGVGYKFEKLADGRENITKISNFFAPAYTTQAIGFEYKPVSYFSLQISPLSMRQTIVADKKLIQTVPNNYGVAKDKTIKNEFGFLQLVADYNRDFSKDLNFKWRYQAFAPYPLKDASGQREKFLGHIDNRLDAQLTAKFAKYFNFNFGLTALYFQNQATKVQLAQTMGVGFLYAW